MPYGAIILLAFNIIIILWIIQQNRKHYVFMLDICLCIILYFTLGRISPLPANQVIGIPFNTLTSIYDATWKSHGKYIFRGLIGNILLFVPLGLCLSGHEGKEYKYLLPFLISLSIETIQYFTRLGTFEVDDLICNTIGGILGYELGKQISGQRKGNFIIPGIYLAALGVCCLKSILFN